MLNQVHKFLQLCFVTISLLWGQSLLAAGFYLSEVGTPISVGTGGVANPTNTYSADAAWTNPAGMTGIKEDSSVVGLMVIVPKVEFDSSVADAGGSDGGNAGSVAMIPSYFYTQVLSDKSRFGFSIVAPFGGGVDFGDNFVGRYSAQKVELAGLALTPSYAYKVNDRLSLGVGLSVFYSLVEEEIAINTIAPGDGKAKFEELEDWGYQGILSLTYQLATDTLLGVVYRSEADVDLEGELKIEGLLVPLPVVSAGLSWVNPQWLELGLRRELSNQQTLFFNLGWQEWSSFSQNILSVSPAGISKTVDRQWDNTWHAGAGYKQIINTESFYTLGMSYESSPVKDEHRTFDFAVDELWKLAGSYAWLNQANLEKDVINAGAYGYLEKALTTAC